MSVNVKIGSNSEKQIDFLAFYRKGCTCILFPVCDNIGSYDGWDYPDIACRNYHIFFQQGFIFGIYYGNGVVAVW